VQVEIRLARLFTGEEIAEATTDADGIIVTTDPLPAAFIARLGPKVRIIARAGIGLDAIDLDAARARGIAVFHIPDYASAEVATHAVAMILALNRRIVQGDAVARTDWPGWRQLAPVIPLHEQTVGVLGCGRIGRAVIERLIPLCRSIVAFDPYVTETPLGVHMAGSLDEVLSQSDVITLHMALTEETRSLLNEQTLRRLKPGAMVVNVSRGGLIDQAALVLALISGQVGGAALDVLEQEPPLPSDPILSAPNVILSPHFAWYSQASEQRARTMSVDGVIDYLEGRTPRAGRLAVVPGN
jgi:D-3-phosphoglycerate dehydrogenase